MLYVCLFNHIIISTCLLSLLVIICQYSLPNSPYFQVLIFSDSSHFIFSQNHPCLESEKLSYSEEWILDLRRSWKINFFIIHFFRQSFSTFRYSNSRHHNSCSLTSLSVGIFIYRHPYRNWKIIVELREPT